MAEERSRTMTRRMCEFILAKNYGALTSFVADHDIVDETMTDYDTLAFACQKNDRVAAEILLDGGARVQKEGTRLVLSPLHSAVMVHYNEQLTRLILGRNYSFRSLDARDHGPLVEFLYKKLRNGYSERVAVLVLSAYLGERYNPAVDGAMTPAHVACVVRSDKLLKRFVKLDVGCVNRQIRKCIDADLMGLYPLHLAVWYRHTNKVRFLLRRGASVWSRSSSAFTPLHYSRLSSPHVNRALFEHVNFNDLMTNLMDDTAKSLFHLVCWIGPGKVVRDLMESGRVNVDSVIQSPRDLLEGHLYIGYTPLHFAVLSKDLEKVKLLVSHGAKIRVEAKTEPRTPLGLAMRDNTYPVIDYLVRLLCSDKDNNSEVTEFLKNLVTYEAVEVYLRSTGTWDTFTALHYAVAREDVKLVEDFLRSGVDVNAIGYFGITPLMVACMIGLRGGEMVFGNVYEMLLELAVSKENLPQFRIVDLLLRYGADADAVDLAGRSALFYLINNSLTIWKMLPLDYRSFRKSKLFEHYFGLVAKLINRSTTERHVSSNGLMLLNIIFNSRDSRIIDEAKSIMGKMLIKANCDVDFKKEDGKTALYLATEQNFIEHAKMLVRRGFDVDVVAEDQSTLLHIISKRPTDERFLRLLLDNGINVNARDCRGNTALHYAVKMTNDHLVEALIDHDADFNIANDEDKTAAWMNQNEEHSHFDVDKARCIAPHLQRMRALGRAMCPQNERFLEAYSERFDNYSTEQQRMEQEVEYMKLLKIYRSLTVYELIFQKSEFDLRFYTNNEEFTEKVTRQDFNEKFPCYGAIASARLRRTRLRESLLAAGRKALAQVVPSLKSVEVADNVLRYFNLPELRRLAGFTAVSEKEARVREFQRRAQLAISRCQSARKRRISI